LHEQGLDEIVARKLHLDLPPTDLREWDNVVNAIEHPQRQVNIGLVGKYIDLADSYKSLNEALKHAGIHTRTSVSVNYIDSEEIEKSGSSCLHGMDAILVPGGFGNRGIEGKIAAAQYARENGVPYLGICLGMQVAVIEYARHKTSLEGANSTEFDRNARHPVIALITEWQDTEGRIEHRDESSELGGTMRLGGQQCRLFKGSRVMALYNEEIITERHRHRYEFNNCYRDRLTTAGLRISGTSIDGKLVEIIELPEHPWFIACQFHPEFTSNPRDGHPLFTGFIRAANKFHDSRFPELKNAVV